MALHDGRIANLPTIEGHAYISVLTAYLHSLTGLSVFVITNSDVIAKEDGVLLQNVYNFLKLQTGIIQGTQDKFTKQYQYLQDVIYISYEQLGYDFLQDNLAMSLSDIVQLKLYYFAIIQDVSYVLLQGTTQPLQLERQANIPEFVKQQYHTIAHEIVTNHLVKNKHYEIIQTSFDYVHRMGTPRDVSNKVERKSLSCRLLPQIQLTRSGQKLVQELLPQKLLDYPHVPLTIHWNYYLLNAIVAKECYTAGKDYEVISLKMDGENERMEGVFFPTKQIQSKQFSDRSRLAFPIGLQQALEIKEGITPISSTPHIVGRITLQKLLRLFPKLSGLMHVPITTTQNQMIASQKSKQWSVLSSLNMLKKVFLPKFLRSIVAEEEYQDAHKDILLQNMEEFFNIYQLKMMNIPPHVIETHRVGEINNIVKKYTATADIFLNNQSEKVKEITNLVSKLHQQRRPILINTASKEDAIYIESNLADNQSNHIFQFYSFHLICCAILDLEANMITGTETSEELELAMDRLLQGGSLDTITIVTHRNNHHQPIRLGGSAKAMVKTFLKYMFYYGLNLLTTNEKERIDQSIQYANTLLGVSTKSHSLLPLPTMTALAHFFNFPLPISIDYGMEKALQELIGAVIQTVEWNVELKQHRGISRLEVVTFLSQILDRYVSPATDDLIALKHHAKSLITLFNRGIHSHKEEIIRKGGLAVINVGHQSSQLEDLGLYLDYFGSETIDFYSHVADEDAVEDSSSLSNDHSGVVSPSWPSLVIPETIQTIASAEDPFYYEINSHAVPGNFIFPFVNSLVPTYHLYPFLYYVDFKEERDLPTRSMLLSSVAHQRQAAHTNYVQTQRSISYQFDEILSFQRSSLYSQRRAFLTSSERGMLDIFYTYCTQTLDELYTQSFINPNKGESIRFSSERHPTMNYTLLYSNLQHYFPTMDVSLHDLQSQDTNVRN
jgi:preprotein translocase subunit SecA